MMKTRLSKRQSVLGFLFLLFFCLLCVCMGVGVGGSMWVCFNVAVTLLLVSTFTSLFAVCSSHQQSFDFFPKTLARLSNVFLFLGL